MSVEVTSHLRPQLLGRMTQRAVVETLKANGPSTRADISRLTGISPTTVSSAVVQVLKSGLIEEIDATISGPGRPGKILRLNTATAQVIGISIEPEWCEVLAGGLDGKPHPKRQIRFPTPNTYSRLMAEIERNAKKWIDDDCRMLGIGVSLPGILDPGVERSVFSPNIHQTNGQRPVRDLHIRLKLPTVMIQESDALCLAERRVHKTDDLAIIDYSGGLGIGILTGGRLLATHQHLPRELGHITMVKDGGLVCGCGNRGCLETVSTDNALTRLVNQKHGLSYTVEEMMLAIREGRINAEAEIENVLDYLAITVAATANMFAPPLMVMHGRMLDLAPDLLERLNEKANARKLPPYRDQCRMVKTTTTKAQGALAGILDYLFEELGPLLPVNA